MKKLTLIFFMLALSSCLKTRSELAGIEQGNVYSERMAANQLEAQQEQQPAIPPDTATTPTSLPDDKDELIRSLNGRVEILENQIQTITKEREEEKKQFEEKLTLLQEALVKLENEIHPPAPSDDKTAEKKPEGVPTGEPGMQSSDDLAKKEKSVKSDKNSKTEKPETKKAEKKQSPLEAGEDYYAKQDWKKAILSFHQYTDESPKGKHVPEAKYKIGVCFQQLGMKEEALAYFEEVAANYGSTEAGKKSKSRLAKLKK